jgi:hypothetical protein
MITKKQKTVIAYLTGRTPLELKDELKDGVPTPSDMDIKNLLCTLPSDYLHKIHIGPCGDLFKQLCNEAMGRIAEADMKKFGPRYGRVASTGVVNDVEPHEVGQSTVPAKG